ncbi:MAG: hypothetical protein HY684_01985 [Chloroflexi bacterium]|nr:hypothetical protein [Chloroflexota bacterium]
MKTPLFERRGFVASPSAPRRLGELAVVLVGFMLSACLTPPASDTGRTVVSGTVGTTPAMMAGARLGRDYEQNGLRYTMLATDRLRSRSGAATVWIALQVKNLTSGRLYISPWTDVWLLADGPGSDDATAPSLGSVDVVDDRGHTLLEKGDVRLLLPNSTVTLILTFWEARATDQVALFIGPTRAFNVGFDAK